MGLNVETTLPQKPLFSFFPQAERRGSPKGSVLFQHRMTWASLFTLLPSPPYPLTPTGPHPFLHWTKLTFTAGQGGGHPEHLHIQQSDLASEEISDTSLRARRQAPTHLTATG